MSKLAASPDIEYIQNWSLWLDIKIIIKTIFKGFIGKNAY
ncbi:sugar transferase [Citrobacter sp. RHBSTW-00229]|nr:sugar transferase [Citrobacter sp. RHBSTW-00229]